MVAAVTQTPPPSLWSEIKTKLITHEDKFHMHKVIGILVLLIFIHRFSMVGKGDMGFASHPEWTIPTLTVHLSLALTSLGFKIPSRRIKDGGRIWPEYRLHAMCFACRSMAAILLYSYEKHYNLEPNYDLNLLVVIGGLLAADAATYSLDEKYRSRSVRDLDTHPATKFFFSFMQFNAATQLLFGLRRCTQPYLIIFVVQVTPFVATLRRKHLFTSNFWGAFTYGAMLAASFVITQYEMYRYTTTNAFLVVRTVANLAALQRMSPLPPIFKPLQNKYVVWTTAFLLIRSIRPHIDEIATGTLKMAMAASALGVIGLGYLKTQQGLKEQNKDKKL